MKNNKASWQSRLTPQGRFLNLRSPMLLAGRCEDASKQGNNWSNRYERQLLKNDSASTNQERPAGMQ